MTRAKRKRNQQKVRQFKHQNGLCCWCLKPMELKEMTADEWAQRASFPNLATWEHLVPLARGGTDSRFNRVLAHRFCNNERGVKVRNPHFGPYQTKHRCSVTEESPP